MTLDDSTPEAPAERTFAVIVPYRRDRGPRDAIWTWMRQRWERNFPGVPIVTATGGRGTWNRPAAVNAAVAKAPAVSHYVIADCDVWVNPAALRAAVEACTDYAFPWDVQLDVVKGATKGLLAAGPGTALTERLLRGRALTRPTYLGGMVVVSAEAFAAAGGMDERFYGWGFDDTALIYRLDAAAGRKRINDVPRQRANLVHLWHPRMPDADAPGAEVTELFNEYRRDRGLDAWRPRARD